MLKNNCPEGYGLAYYAVGGRLCKKCVKKQARGGKQVDAITEFKNRPKKACGGIKFGRV